MLEFKTAPGARVDRVGWFWPIGLAVSAFASAGIIWAGLLLVYDQIVPYHLCQQLSVGYQLASWITFIMSGGGLLTLTLMAADKLRVQMTATMVLTTILMLPLILLGALSLFAINHGDFSEWSICVN
jgi:hypothetical protein